MGTIGFRGMEDPLEGVVLSDTELSMITVRDVIDGFSMLQDGEENGGYPNWNCSWDVKETEMDLEQKMMQFAYENPGRSRSAIVRKFKKEGFSRGEILETYTVLVYDKKILRRIDVGTAKSPRYAHFAVDLFVDNPGKDALYDVLGPL